MFGTTQLSSIQIGKGFVSEEYPDKISDGVDDRWDFNFELKNFHDEKTEKVSDDIVNLLPSDPFGMDIGATLTAITGWIEEFEKDLGLSALGFVTDETEVKTSDDRILNLVLNGAMRFYPEVSHVKSDGKLVGPEAQNELLNDLYDNSDANEFLIFSIEKYRASGNAAIEYQGCTKDLCDGGEGRAPHDGLFFALGHLGVKDLLAVERVCKSLHKAVQNDPLLWRNIQIDRPLNDKISDDTLFDLTSRAQGSLRCLSLVGCLYITDGGLKRVMENNPWLTKLSVPGCTKLSVEGIVRSLKAFKSAGAPGIKSLRIGGVSGVTEKHFEELKILLDLDHHHKQWSAYKPRFYRGGQLYLSFDDDRAIDIEVCPRCQQIRQVYDCPAENCQGKHRATCRACTFCISRCMYCGCCFKGRDYEETFFLDLVCMGCRKQSHSFFYQQATYHFCFYG